ncbi:Trehalase [Cucumispora dikerogammari]|nr:Trehalase [Cucumispora dikerogammari]
MNFNCVHFQKNFCSLSDLETQTDIIREPKYYNLDPSALNSMKSEYPAINTFLLAQFLTNDDSKSFVDRPTKKPFSLIEEELETLQLRLKKDLLSRNLKLDYSQPTNTLASEITNQNKDYKTEIENFLNSNFYETGADLHHIKPVDYIETPKLMKTLCNPELINMVKKLNEAMSELSKIKDLKEKSESTLLDLKHPFFIPGGRFRELYYWDSFWILKGLLSLDMKRSSENILMNFTEVINKYGHFPNGTRTYYINRSQLPLFPSMLRLLYKFDHLKNYILSDGLKAALVEYNYFMKNFAEKEGLNYYRVTSNFPRLESFFEDMYKYEYKKDQKIFTEIKSIAESGWDFSSRWEEKDSLIITNLLPADLNSILYENEMIISFLYNEKKEPEQGDFFLQKANKRKTAINKFLWNPDTKTYADYNYTTNKHSKEFYASNLFPIIYNVAEKSTIYTALLNDFENIFGHEGGIPASSKYSGKQWDFPNVWAPYTEAIENYLFNNDQKFLAKHIAKTFFNNAQRVFKKKSVFYEKYAANELGVAGRGGEYKAQAGFGWTNGTLLCFIERYGDELMSFNFEESKTQCYEILKSLVKF